MRVYEAIVKALEGLGVDAAFGGAGENAASLMLALKHSDKIRAVITRNEQAASLWLAATPSIRTAFRFLLRHRGPGRI
jgi:acetolactate synthase-1/2/3 large subunit